jgi:hypothetical protein
MCVKCPGFGGSIKGLFSWKCIKITVGEVMTCSMADTAVDSSEKLGPSYCWGKGSQTIKSLWSLISVFPIKIQMADVQLCLVHAYSVVFSLVKAVHKFDLGDRCSTVVKVLCYKSEGRWFDPRWCHGIFHWHKSVRSHYSPGVDSASNRYEYQESFLGVNAAGA